MECWGSGIGYAYPQAGTEATFSGGESQGIPREMGGSVLQTAANKRQADWSWAEGRGSWELQPALCWTRREVHTYPNLLPRRAGGRHRTFSLHPQRNAKPGEGFHEAGPSAPPAHTQPAIWRARVPAPTTQIPQVGPDWIGSGMKYPSSPGSRGDKGPPLTSGILERYLSSWSMLTAHSPNKILLEKAEEKDYKSYF